MSLGGRWPLRRRMRFVAQMTASECPVACLAMVLAHHGRAVPRRRLRAALTTGSAGASAHDLLEAARSFGLIGRGVRRPAGSVDGLAAGSILHWDAKHFVVLERAARDHAWILDPAIGRRRVDLATLEQSFSGLALIFSPGSSSTQGAPGTPGTNDAQGAPGTISAQGAPETSDAPSVESSPSRWVIRRAAWRPRVVLPILVASLVSILAGVAAARVMADVIARLAAPQPRFGELAAAIAVIALATIVARTWRERRLHALGAAIERDLGRGLVAQLVRLPPGFYRHRSTADLEARLTSVPGLSQRVARALGSLLTDAPMAAAYLAVLLGWSTVMGLADAVIVAAYLGTSITVRRARERDARTVARSDGDTRRFEAQLLEQIAGIKAAGSELAVEQRWHRLQREAATAGDRARKHLLGIGALDGFGVIIPLTLLAVGGHAVVSGSSSLAAMIGINYLACAVFRPIDALIGTVESLGAIRQSLDRIDDVLLESAPAGSAAGAAGTAGVTGVTTRVPARIDLVDVTVRGDGGALDGVSLAIESARHVAIVGAGGADTSALAAVIAGFVRPDAGRIAIDGHDLAHLALGDRPASLVTGSVALFDGCIRDNVALAGAGVTDDAVASACRLAGLHDEIQALPLGYRTAVYDGGRNLPVALRRRMLIARALVQGAPLVVLDGAAAALGARAEGDLLDAIRAQPARMVVTVSEHRSTIERADLVIVLERGRLVDAGPPSALEARCRLYRELTAPVARDRSAAIDLDLDLDLVREAV